MTKLTVQDFGALKKYIVKTNELLGGGQITFNFPNGYGASLVHHKGSYGREIAVLKNSELYYDTNITSDVLGHLEEHEIIEMLYKIKDLKAGKESFNQP